MHVGSDIDDEMMKIRMMQIDKKDALAPG